MRPAIAGSHTLCRVALVALAAGLLSGCQTDGGPTDPFSELAAYHARNQAPGAADRSAEKPKSRAQTAMDCWALAEKSQASASLDAKGDFVNKCIDARMHPGEARTESDAPGRAAKPNSKPNPKPKAAAKPKPETSAKPPS